nr:ribonuclease H-like domain-containing protein [Tanacetum cinerariifolium]
FDNDSDNASIHNEATNTQQQPNIQPQIITTVSNNNAKFPYLKKDEYEVWAMTMEYWITNNDINICKRESKARNTLLQSIPDDHVADFHYMDDARIYGMQLKLEFRIRKEEGLHKGYDRMQKILSQLNQLKAKPDAEDINIKFLRALPSSWSRVALTLKIKGGIEFLSFDDLYYKLKTLEVDVKGYNAFSSSQSAGLSHSTFVSATSTSKKMSYGESTNYSSTTTYSVPSNSKTGSHRSGNVIEYVLQLFVADTEPEQQLAYEDLKQIEKLDLEYMDLKCKSDGVIAAKEFGMIAGCDFEDAIKDGVAKLYNLITGANSEVANTTGDAGEFALMGVTSENKSGIGLYKLYKRM